MNIFFDLDGTLIESHPGIFEALEHTFSEMKIDYSNIDFMTLIGPPLYEGFSWYMEKERVNDAIKIFSKYYSEQKMMLNVSLFDGVEMMLKELSKENEIILSTSKSHKLAVEILESLDIYKYFDHIQGAIREKNLSDKDDIVKKIIDDLNIKKAMIVGDRFYDIEAGKKFNFICVGALYGYGNKKELEEYESDFLIEKPTDLIKIVEDLNE